jgi:hypothetical protein
VEALGEFLKTDDGANLLVGVRRAINIVRDEEKKDKKSYAGAADAALLRAPQEQALHAAIQKVKHDTAAAINVENFAGAMRALAELRAPVDAFFDKVTVNVADGLDAAQLRANRLALLSGIRAATLTVADFSRIAGWARRATARPRKRHRPIDGCGAGRGSANAAAGHASARLRRPRVPKTAIAKGNERRMTPDATSTPDVTVRIEKLARFAMLCTVAIGAVLLIMEIVGGPGRRLGLLTERTTMTLLWVIGVELIATVAALACLALWKR